MRQQFVVHIGLDREILRGAANITEQCSREALADFLAITVGKSSSLHGISHGDWSVTSPILAQTTNLIWEQPSAMECILLEKTRNKEEKAWKVLGY